MSDPIDIDKAENAIGLYESSLSRGPGSCPCKLCEVRRLFPLALSELRDLRADNARLREAVRVLREAMEPLVRACEVELSDGMNEQPDDEPVMAGVGENYRCEITFGKIRRARAALNGEAPIDSDGARPQSQQGG